MSPVEYQTPDKIHLPVDPNNDVDPNAREQAERNWTGARAWLREVKAPDFQALVEKILREDWQHMLPVEKRAVYALAMNAILELTARVHEDAEMGGVTLEETQSLWDCVEA